MIFFFQQRDHISSLEGKLKRHGLIGPWLGFSALGVWEAPSRPRAPCGFASRVKGGGSRKWCVGEAQSVSVFFFQLVFFFLGGGFKFHFFFVVLPPIWGKISNLTHIFFQMGWFNHQIQLFFKRPLFLWLNSAWSAIFFWEIELGVPWRSFVIYPLGNGWHIPLLEKEHHLRKCLGIGYVGSLGYSSSQSFSQVISVLILLGRAGTHGSVWQCWGDWNSTG